MDLWPSAEVKVFGSYATQSLLPTSDIDIVVMGAQTTHTQPIFALSEELLKHKGMAKLHVIPTAKVSELCFCAFLSHCYSNDALLD